MPSKPNLPANTLPRLLVAMHSGWVRSAVGAALGIALAGLTTWAMLHSQSKMAHPALPFLIAPLGASAVLVFCVPASPLAGPWAVIGGDLLSAAIGLAIGHLIDTPWLAGGVAVGLAIVVMNLARCLHPPGGACALLCALGTGGLPWSPALMVPVTANVFLLCTVGWAYNKATGHPWPHKAPPLPQPDDVREHVVAVIADWDEVLDVDVDDLDAFVQAVMRRKAGLPVLQRRGRALPD